MQAVPHPEDVLPGTEVEATVGAWIDAIGAGGGLAAVAECSDAECESLYTLGYGLYARGRHAEAVQIFGFLVLLRSLEPRFVFSLAACLQALGRYADAIDHYATALVIDAENPAPLLHLSECLVALRHFEQARASLATLCAEYPAAEFPEMAAKAARLSRLVAREEVRFEEVHSAGSMP